MCTYLGGISITKQSLGGSLETRSKIDILGRSKKIKTMHTHSASIDVIFVVKIEMQTRLIQIQTKMTIYCACAIEDIPIFPSLCPRQFEY